jgi:hypothetical protein
MLRAVARQVGELSWEPVEGGIRAAARARVTGSLRTGDALPIVSRNLESRDRVDDRRGIAGRPVALEVGAERRMDGSCSVELHGSWAQDAGETDKR